MRILAEKQDRYRIENVIASNDTPRKIDQFDEKRECSVSFPQTIV